MLMKIIPTCLSCVQTVYKLRLASYGHKTVTNRRREVNSDPELPTTVVNLSGIALEEAEINLLSKGLSFCPSPRHIRKEEILDDLEKYFRRLRLKEFFLEEEEEEDSDANSLFRPP